MEAADLTAVIVVFVVVYVAPLWPDNFFKATLTLRPVLSVATTSSFTSPSILLEIDGLVQVARRITSSSTILK